MPTGEQLITMLSSITVQQNARIELLERQLAEHTEMFEMLLDAFSEQARKNKDWIDHFNKRIEPQENKRRVMGL